MGARGAVAYPNTVSAGSVVTWGVGRRRSSERAASRSRIVVSIIHLAHLGMQPLANVGVCCIRWVLEMEGGRGW